MTKPLPADDQAKSGAEANLAHLGLALEHAHAVVEFAPDGEILRANDLFFELTGYPQEEIVGSHHRMLCEPSYTASTDYSGFWQDLRAGDAKDGEFKRIGRGGRELWLRGRYYPVVTDNVVTKVIALSMDVTEAKQESLHHEGLLNAIDRAQGIIEFDLSGNVITANDIFLDITGYALSEITGKHHRMFCTPEYGRSGEYDVFWDKLGGGEVHSGTFKRLGKGGREVWIQATYNPIFDLRGRPTRIVKYATDMTAQRQAAAEAEGKVLAISRSHAVIEFDLNGTILGANDNFCQLLGYSPEEVVGQHHRMFCDPGYSGSQDYLRFWQKLSRGEHDSGEYRRVTKGGGDCWIQASYSPILDLNGKPWKVVKYALDVTTERRINNDYRGKIEAIGRAQAVIEFDLDGNVLEANPTFLDIMGYSLEEVRGKHHRIFCEPEVVQTREYQDFWNTLSRGEYHSGEFKRVGRGGKTVWIRATYNPILDLAGKPVKIVKFAVDVTSERLRTAEFEGQVAAVDRSQATIEFDLSGNVMTANTNFLSVMGYTLREIVGQHHSMFCDSTYLKSREYGDFWRNLNEGKTHSGRFHRVGKFGRDVYIQASYGPILDLSGKPMRVIKHAYDVTMQVELEQKVTAKSQEMQAKITELADSIRAITTGASGAAELAAATQHAARDGSDAINNAIEAIDLISKSSKQIAKIVTVIGELASQTNLLAFNAAIEAVRAGEQGVGFSVVAEEVRKLAEHSAKAATEITDLIEESSARVAAGTDRSHSARNAFEEIARSVQDTAASIHQISESAAVQEGVSIQVSDIIADMVSSTHAVAA
ncbi:methyl-accepting chemotaxis protein [Sphingomonas sp. Tas61C01]|uniref:methyl-accepting chemotaxis protein n=1 Tax=Sphingomonas sp. Tas61C01 TaxID=3458297 RepID=UPI00403E9A95